MYICVSKANVFVHFKPIDYDEFNENEQKGLHSPKKSGAKYDKKKGGHEHDQVFLGLFISFKTIIYSFVYIDQPKFSMFINIHINDIIILSLCSFLA